MIVDKGKVCKDDLLHIKLPKVTRAYLFVSVDIQSGKVLMFNVSETLFVSGSSKERLISRSFSFIN